MYMLLFYGSLVPWKEVEEKYSKLFVANNGRPAIPVRVALGALMLNNEEAACEKK